MKRCLLRIEWRRGKAIMPYPKDGMSYNLSLYYLLIIEGEMQTDCEWFDSKSS